MDTLTSSGTPAAQPETPRQQVDIMDPTHRFFGKVYAAVNAASGRKSPEYDGLKIPDSVQEKAAFIECLLGLFGVSWEAQGSAYLPKGQASFKEGEKPASGRAFPDAVYARDAENMVAALMAVVPDPEKDGEAFTAFVRSRTEGVFEAMRLLINLQAKAADTDKTVREAAVLGMPLIGDDGTPRFLHDMPAQERRPHLQDRIKRLDLMTKVPQLVAENKQLLSVIAQKFAPYTAVLQSVVQAYVANIGKFTVNHTAPEHSNAQWFNVLLSRLNDFDMTRPDVLVRLQQLQESLVKAKNVQQFASAINNFGQI